MAITPQTEIERAEEIWLLSASKDAQAKAHRYVATNIANWRMDPHVKNVVGLVLEGTNQAIVVIYIDDEDFEVDDRYF